MTDWKTDLRTLADKLRADQKIKKDFKVSSLRLLATKRNLALTIQVFRSPQKQQRV